MNKATILILSLILPIFIWAQKQVNYKTPPKEIVNLLNAPTTPSISVSPQSKWLLQLGVKQYASIQEVSKHELRIGGVRINPENFSQSRALYNDSLILTSVSNGKDFIVTNLPETQNLRHFCWSPNGKYVAFTNTTPVGVELWLLDVIKKRASKLTDAILNNSLAINPFSWLDKGEWIIFTAIDGNKESPPVKPVIPTGPIIREAKGIESAAKTYHDLIKDKYDAKLFEYYTKSQLTKISINKEMYNIGTPAIFKEFTASPDGEYILVKMIKRPFSYMVPFYNFPFKAEIWDSEGNLFRELFKIPSAEYIPKGRDAVRKGPRNIAWRADVPSSIYWVQAQDGGDPNRKAVNRDRLYLFDAPFDGEGHESIVFQNRFKKISWGTDNIAISYEGWWKTRTTKVCVFKPVKPGAKKKIIYEYNWQDEYNNPGTFMINKNEYGNKVLQFGNKNTELYLSGKGATTEGYKPFVDKFIIETKETKRLWQSNNPYYEYPICNIDMDKNLILTKRESKTDFPNYFSRNLLNGVVSQITNFPNPTPELSAVKSELLTYTRADNVQLSAKLYLPPGYTVGDGLLPVIIKVYPKEYKNVSSASQIKDSPNRFIQITWSSPIFWLSQGYAVLDNVTMPIVLENSSEPNIALEQLIANAKATINCLDRVAIADKSRIAIVGHGYGAYVSASLLAHTNLFTAGVVQSGANNHTITPFGFYTEERTFWESKEAYMRMSPLSFANQINEPILLIHGDSDNNIDTSPLQSELFFNALKGNGQISRLILLPHESHNLQAKESILHMLWEMNKWLEKHTKNKAAN